MLKLFATKRARILLALVGLVGLYALAGFVIAPKVVRYELTKQIPAAVAATPTVGEIRVNPFLFQLTVENFALHAADGAALLGFKRIFIDFEPSSLWDRAYTFRRLELTEPFVNASVAQDGSINLAALRPKPSSAPAPQAATHEPLPSIRLAELKVIKGTLSYADKSRRTEFATRLEPIDLDLKDFSTRVESGLFTLTGTTQLGERLEWRGRMSLQPLESQGELSVAGLRAATLWQYVEDQVSFGVASGSIDFSADYKFALADGVDLKFNLSRFALNDLAVRPKGADMDWITLPSLTLTGASLDLKKRAAHVESLALTGLKVSAWLEPDGKLNLLSLAATPADAAAPATPPGARGAAVAVTVVNPPPAASSAPWQADLRHFALHDAAITAEDRTVQPATKIALAPLSLEVEGASLDLSKPLRISFDTHVNETGSLTAKGELTPAPLAAALNLGISSLDLPVLQPYLAPRTDMILKSGKFSAETKVSYAQPAQGANPKKASPKPDIKLSGDLHVEGLRTVDKARNDDLVNWQRLDVRGLSYQPDRLEIAEILAQKPYARVIIESDSSLNVTRVLEGPSVPAATPAAKAAVAAARAAPTPAASSASVAPSAHPPLPLSIKRVLVHDGRVNFTDLSIAPQFSAGIQRLEGGVTGLSSQPNSRAKVDLHGRVDEFAPVSIEGEVNILSAALYTDLAMNFENMELSIFNPYSGKFAGYNITKGKLTTNLHYKVNARALDAQHHIRIDQLEFGAKTESKDAVSLPVKLAVALLKDRNGVIELDLPVTGSLDDPKFRVGPIIWKVLVSLLEKAVTAPFNLIAGLFKKGPEIQFIDFHPGESSLDETATDRLKTVAKGLADRPQLEIDVPIAFVADLDRPALLARRYGERLAEVRAALADGKKSAPATTPFEQLDPEAKLKILSAFYVRELGGEPKYPDSVTSSKQKADVLAAKLDFLASSIQGHLALGDGELRALGEQRAMALQQALLTDTQIEPQRVFLVANDKAAAAQGAVRLELTLH